MNTQQFPKMHVSLFVSDLGKTVEFYTKFFGQEPEKIKDGYTKYELVAPALIISFIEASEKVAPQAGHFGFQVETKEELNDKLNMARGMGLVQKEEIDTACCYAIQDKYWAVDPDGYQWEVYYFHEDVEFNDPRINDTKEACCSPAITTKDGINKKEPDQTKEAACC